MCDNQGVCFCKDHTRGKDCSECEVGYFGKCMRNAYFKLIGFFIGFKFIAGDSLNGGNCYKSCEGRAVIEEPFGFFGRIEQSSVNLSASKDNCLWIIKAAAVDDKNSPRGIKIKILPNFKISCLENTLKIYRGLPSFSRSAKVAPLVAAVCAYGKSDSTELVEVNVEGDLVSILLEHASASEIQFNASFEGFSTISNRTENNLPIETNTFPTSITARYGHSVLVSQENVFIFGGYSYGVGALNDIRQFRLDINQWAPIIIVCV